MNNLVYALAAAALFMAGYNTHSYLHTCPVAETKVVTEYKDRVQTEVVYVPKAAEEKADIDIKINKPELHVKVNEKEFIVQKADNEAYLFEKNKLSMTQTSNTDLNITVPTIDKTKRWEIGVGISKDGMVGLLGFPVGKREYIGGWVAGNSDLQMGGLTFKF